MEGVFEIPEENTFRNPKTTNWCMFSKLMGDRGGKLNQIFDSRALDEIERSVIKLNSVLLEAIQPGLSN